MRRQSNFHEERNRISVLKINELEANSKNKKGSDNDFYRDLNYLMRGC
jgi:hypothetical protein